MNRRALLKHAIPLWILAPWLLYLSAFPPHVESRDRARFLPQQLGRFHYFTDHLLTPAQRTMLGTDDARQLEYRAGPDEAIFLTTVFHDANWKAVHPPHLCLRGSDMTFGVDTIEDISLSDGAVGTIGHLELIKLATGKPYISLFAFVAPPDLLTGSYWTFFFHHLPRALLRRSASGCLVRIDADVREGDPVEALARCREFAQLVLPRLRRIVATR